MAKDRHEKSDYEQGDDYRDDEFDEEESAEIEEPSFEAPLCPRCGWHNTRPSHTWNMFDSVVRVFGLRPFRCRSCGNRFRTLRRVRKAS